MKSDIKIINEKISKEELVQLAKTFYVTMIKGVVDLETESVAFGGEYHIDANNYLIENGSKQANLWGFNIFFDRPRESWIEYTSLINIRPQVGNMEMEVKDQSIRNRMKRIIDSKIS